MTIRTSPSLALSLFIGIVLSCKEDAVKPAPSAAEKYTVTFDTGAGGSVVEAVTVGNNQKISPPANPTRTGYTFAGWYTAASGGAVFDFDATLIMADQILYAHWTPEPSAPTTHTVTFDTGAGGSAVADAMVTAGQMVQRPAADPTRTGYTFTGWYTAASGGAVFDFDATLIMADQILYAHWTPEPSAPTTHTVTFDTGAGGSAVADAMVTAGQMVQRPAADPTRTDYTFAGWYTAASGGVVFDFAATLITADQTIYAVWTLRFVSIDPNFASYLKTILPADAFMSNKLDAQHPDVMSYNGKMDVSNKSISSLDGLQYFLELTELNCSFNNALGSRGLDVSRNTKLAALSCAQCQLKMLDVSHNTVLTDLDCNQNDLGGLDLSQNTALINVSCGSNQLFDLMLENSVALEMLSCESNSLTNLDLSKNTALTKLDCSVNMLTSLDVSKNVNLDSLDCNRNSLTNLDLSKNTMLEDFRCDNNPLITLDITGMRRVSHVLAIPQASLSPLVTLKVHDNLKDCGQIALLKGNLGMKLTVSTYSAANGSTAYVETSANYTPSLPGSPCP